MLDMSWEITFITEGISYRLATLEACEIDCSVDNLADKAIITLPASVLNTPLLIEEKIKIGSSLKIMLGYNNILENEFEGFVEKITNDGSLIIHCEDALFLFRKSVPDTQLKPTSIKAIGEYLIAHINPSYSITCDLPIDYEKFTIHQNTGYDVLKKLQEETKASIYFDTKNKVLHIHPPFLEKSGSVIYSMHLNIEKSSLESKKAIDKKIEITVESAGLKGKMKRKTVGHSKGGKINLSVGAMIDTAMTLVADSALLRERFDGYDGSFQTWLTPFVAPSFSAKITDHDYPYKTGWYYVVGVKTTFNAAGGIRTITPGIRLSYG